MGGHTIKTEDKNDPKGEFKVVLMAQLAAVVVVSMVVGMLSDHLYLAVSSGYGALIMLLVNTVLARRIQSWHLLPTGGLRSRAMMLAGGRFVLVVVLLVAAYFLGMWLPAVAGGMLVAQIALYLAGFWLLVHSAETKKGLKGEAL